MGMIPCPECRKRVNTTAESCPKCGHRFGDGEIAAIEAKNKKIANGCAVILAILLIPFFWSIFSDAFSQNRPRETGTLYRVHRQAALGPGSSRVELRVNGLISEAECSRIISKERSKAGKNGQVSVHAPTKQDPSYFVVLCYDNLDGKGTQVGVGRQVLKLGK